MSIEFVAVLPLLAIAALACLQALLLGIGVVFAQVAVDRAATGSSDVQVVRSLPAPWRGGSKVARDGDLVRVQVAVPLVVPGVATPLHVAATSAQEST